MTTPQSWSTVVAHTTDAEFRTWVAEWITKALATGGLTQTADTGQINTATVTRPGATTEGGFAVFYLNDSLHGTAPVYFRIGFGSGGATAPRIQITVGTGTNGAGTLTGTALTTTRSCNISGSAPTSTVTAYNSYMCATAGFFGFSWKAGTGGNQNGNRGSFYFSRSLDSAGAISAQGGFVVWGGASNSILGAQSLRFASTAAAYTATASVTHCQIPGAVTSSSVGANFQAYLTFMAIPDVQCAFGMAAAITTELAVGNSFSMAPVAGVSHTYINLGAVNSAEVSNTPTTYGQCMLWE